MIKPIVSEERLRKALTYLAETDETCAQAKALMKGLEKQEKTKIAIAFLAAEGPQGERKEIAYESEAYRSHVETYENAVADYETMNNKRNTEILIVEVWRSLNANRNRGNL